MTGKIVHFTSVHPWDDVRIFDKECRSLAAAGHDVHVVAAGGGRLSGECNRDTAGKLVERRQVDGVTVHHLRGAAPRGRIARALWLSAEVTAYARSLKGDLYHFHDPELLPHAFLRLRDRVTIYDIHENLALQIESKPWIPALLKHPAAFAVRFGEAFFAHRCDGLVAATPEVLDRFLPRASPDSAVVAANAPSAAWLSAPVSPLASRPARITYIGSLTAERGITDLVDAMAEGRLACRAEGLDLAGPISAEYLSYLRTRPGFVNAVYHGILDRLSVQALLARTCVGVAMLHPFENYRASRPIKISEYLASGLLVVASDFPLWRRLFAANSAIRFLEPQDPKTLAAALADALDACKLSTIESSDRSAMATWEQAFAELQTLYARLLGASRP